MTVSTFDVRQWDMRLWKRTVADLVRARSVSEVRLEHRGGANQIIAYRLFYMIQFAKRVNLSVCLVTDGLFWTDEADDWLMESGVDRIVVAPPNERVRHEILARARALRHRGFRGITIV